MSAFQVSTHASSAVTRGTCEAHCAAAQAALPQLQLRADLQKSRSAFWRTPPSERYEVRGKRSAARTLEQSRGQLQAQLLSPPGGFKVAVGRVGAAALAGALLGAVAGTVLGGAPFFLVGAFAGGAVGLGLAVGLEVIHICVRAYKSRAAQRMTQKLDRAAEQLAQADVAWRKGELKSVRLLDRAARQQAQGRKFETLSDRAMTQASDLRQGIYRTAALRHTGAVAGVGLCSVQGNRGNMEDRTLVTALRGERLGDATVVAVFDGHSGAAAAETACEAVPKVLQRTLGALSETALRDPVQVRAAIKQAFQDRNPSRDLDISESIQGPGGSTAVVALFLKGELYIANLGDSRAVVVNQGEATRLSYDQKPGDTLEDSKVIARHGRIFTPGPHDIPRVDGRLAMTRALGDNTIQGVGRRPQVTHVPTHLRHGHLVLMSDGVTDALADSTVANVMQRAPRTLEAMSQAVVHAAYAKGSMDNITALVVPLGAA